MTFQSIHTVILDSIDDHIAVIDYLGIIVYVNNAWKNFNVGIGFPLDYDWIGTDYFEYCDSSTVGSDKLTARGEFEIREVLAGRCDSFACEYKIKRNDGSYTWFLGRGMVIERSADGAPHRIIGTHTDISERKQTEDLLRRSEEKHRMLFMDSPDAYLILIDGIFVDCNKAAAVMLHGERSMIIGYPPEILSPDFQPDGKKSAESAEKRITEALQTGKNTFEWLHRRLDGENFYVEVSLAAIELDGKQALFVAWREITGRKKIEAELEATHSKLETLSMTDGLTCIANRRQFDHVLTQEYARHIRSGKELSLILLDIDYFKRFNDHYGHVSGDKCLQQIAGVIGKSVARSGDLAARYGGEEFACILPDTDQQGALFIAEKIRQGIINLAIPHEWSDIAGCVTASLGVVTLTCHKEESASEIVVRADELLYKAKDLGRNRIEYNDVYAEQLDVNFVQLVWQESFTLGNTLIDDQHKALFLNSNQLLHAIINSSTKDEISKIISHLLDTITKHFIDEESILESVGYPLLMEHSIEHEKLKNRALELAVAFNSQELHVGDIFEFLAYNVIKKHMLEYDREYSAYTSD